MKSAKIIVSKDELELVFNKEWLYLKRSIIQKVFDYLGMLHEEFNRIARQKSLLLPYLPIDRMGKISRGENLEGLPYLIMDYPALFTKEKIIAVRTLFWWGNFFSISLHLSGLRASREQILPWIAYFKEHNFHINTSGNEWNYEFDEDGFAPITQESHFYAEAIAGKGILRVSRKKSLSDWNLAYQELLQDFKIIIDFLAVNFPGDEKGLLPGFPKAGLHL